MEGEPDPAQLAVVEMLDQLASDLCAPRQSWWQQLRSKPSGSLRGVYLWGGVGRGKTFLMDLFFDQLEITAKKRAHFHRFMRDVHARLGEIKDASDPLEIVASEIAESARIVCFDEFFVSDIGDAMILGRLLDKLFARQVTLIATSNIPPAELYADGLQRARFLPAIALLEKHCRVVEIGNSTDYRLRTLQDAGVYTVESEQSGATRLQNVLEQLAGGRPPATHSITVHGRDIEIQGLTADAAWFSFSALCEGPRSTADYILLANRFATVLVNSVPPMDDLQNDAARRFIALVDELYDRRVNLVISSNVALNDLYTGRRLKFEFERTRSRLTEMQSSKYLALARRQD